MILPPKDGGFIIITLWNMQESCTFHVSKE